MSGTDLAPLTADEMAAKADLVAVVDRTIRGFTECGEALAEIRDRRLYRDEHPTFEAFVLDRWGFTARRARQLMAAAQDVAALPAGTAVPLTERHVRELSPLRDDPDEMAEALGIAEAVHGKLTGDTIAEAVAHILQRRQTVAGYAEWAPGVDPSEWRHIEALLMAAKVLHGKHVLLPEPPWWSPGESMAGDTWEALVRCDLDDFTGWCRAVGLGDDPARALAGHVDWNDDLLAEWCAIPEFSADDCRSAAVGYVASWLDDDRPPSMWSVVPRVEKVDL